MTGICGALCKTETFGDGARDVRRVAERSPWTKKNMDAVTALSASGPAYAYIILESLAEAGVKVGLPREHRDFLAAQTMKGAASVVLEPAIIRRYSKTRHYTRRLHN